MSAADPPPQDVEAEQAILGTILATAEVNRDQAVKLLDESPAPSDYYRPAHEQISRQLRVNASTDAPLDAIAIFAGLQQAKITGYGGAPYLHTLVSQAKAPGNVPFYTTRIANAAQLRRAIAAVNQAAARLSYAEIDDTGEVRAAVYEAMDALESEAAPPELAGTRSSWRPVDLRPVLDGTWQRPVPEIGQRSDTQPILYPGKQHACYSETEGGKTWFALLLSIHEINKGHNVVYLDWEDDEGEIGNRLLTMSALPSRILDNFTYLRPEEPISIPGNADLLQQLLGDLRPTLVITDGITEAMTVHGYDPNKNDEVALFNRAIPGRITTSGAASLVLDHVTKDRETRGKYALGGVHKLNVLTGAAFILENRTPFAIGITGRSAIYIAKDRSGQLRRHAQKVDQRDWFGDLVVAPLDEQAAPDQVEAYIEPPTLSSRPQRPTIYMTRVCDALKRADKPLPMKGLLARVTGKREVIERAVAALVDEGYIREEKGPHNSMLHTLVRDFDPNEGNTP